MSAPANWERFHPLTVGVSGTIDLSRPTAVGDEFVEHARTRPGTLGWLVLASVPGELWRIRGWAQVGRLWRRELAVLTYRFDRGGPAGGVLITREMTYDPGALRVVLPLVRHRTENDCAVALGRLQTALDAET